MRMAVHRGPADRGPGRRSAALSMLVACSSRRAAARTARGAVRMCGDPDRSSSLPRPMAIDPGIFKAYDVRGLYGEQLDGDAAEQIGRAFARVLAQLGGKQTTDLRVGLGRDMRLTAPEMAARYRAG